MPTAKQVQKAWNDLLAMNWSYSDGFSRVYLDGNEVGRLLGLLSFLRKNKAIDSGERWVISSIIRLGRRRHNDYLDYLRNEPRREAQKFIGKQKIRDFIFKRDGYKCLCCGTDIKLSVDHIVPISRGGKNRLYNLQTLCCSCNSWKSSSIMDFR